MRWLIALLMPLCLSPAQAAEDYSAAEQAIFMRDQFAGLKAPTTLRYSFRKTGSMEPGFEDQVELTLNAKTEGGCCLVHGEFLSGTRRVPLPDMDQGKANPVTLYFLERDIREMNRITRGSQNYFRKRIRMAAYQGATVTPVSLRYRGATVKGQDITLKPYDDDPNRARYGQLAVKEYHFLLSEAVPGGVYAIRTIAHDGASVLLDEDMTIEGAER
ncbi:hypothetical protein [Pelomonas sp. KK5]|uniref:hypothetical protein n=1 Tax=Pelomonas sp. KK5 TaxID=1855730 RepID=UPI00097C2A97|nr:hypothetical protein [Pelomonas sp. KK5]